MALRPIFAAAMTSSCLPELPAATALPVATVTGLVALINSSGGTFFSILSVDWYVCNEIKSFYINPSVVYKLIIYDTTAP